MLDFLVAAASRDTVWIIILLTGVVTYITRCAGPVSYTHLTLPTNREV